MITNFNKYKLFENPDIIEHVDLDGEVYWNNKDAISFGYYKNDLIIKKYGDPNAKHHLMLDKYIKDKKLNKDEIVEEWINVHPEYEGENEPNGRQILDYAGRLWTKRKIITFWSYPENNEILLQILKDISSALRKKFKPDGWRIEVIEEDKEYFAKIEGKWVNDDREDYLLPIEDYKSSGKRSKEEFNQEHEIPPMLKKSKKPEGWSPKKFKYQLPGESEVEARARASKYVYQESNGIKGKFVNVDYKIFQQTWQEKPLLLVTDFKIRNMEDNYLEIISKGYEYVNLVDYGVSDEYKDKSKKGWIPYDDFKSGETKRIPEKAVQNGSKRIKVMYEN
jgi:hypothetical protein